MKSKKYIIISIGDAVTGGPEALHHLASEMNALGLDASICYYPFDKKFNTPEPYKKFNVRVTKYIDEKSSIFIFPEVLPVEALSVKEGSSFIWWLSLDNFFETRHHVSNIRNFFRYFKLCLRGRRPWLGLKSLRNIGHLAQSHYVADFLEKHGLPFASLFEPINPDYLKLAAFEKSNNTLSNAILYNPAKGFHITKKIIEANPDLTFIPLKGFTKEQLLEKFQTSKIYIDFGHHPGRDRMPREAALLGCCLITSRLGSANNTYDIPIPDKYKIDTNSPVFVESVSTLIRDILMNTEQHFNSLLDYRKHIHSENETFRSHILEFSNRFKQ